MTFVVKTLDELHAMLIVDYQGQFPEDDVSRFSDNWKRLRVLAGAVSDLHAHIDFVHDSLLPDKADDEFLDRFGAIYGLTRKPATVANGADVLRLAGDEGAAFTIGDELTTSDGTRFRLTGSGTIPEAGFVDVDLVAIDVGSVGRKEAGEALTFVSAPSGMQSAATLVADIDEEGDDEEPNGDLRQRILDRICYPRMGGNAGDYKAWALEVTGVKSAYVYPVRGGLGTVHLAILRQGSGAGREVSATKRAEVQSYIDARRPEAMLDFRVLTCEPQDQDIEVLVEPEDAGSFDWDDGTSLTVASWDAGTKVLEFTADVPAHVVEGDDLILRPGSTTRERVLVAALGPGDDEVTLASAPSTAPTAGAEVIAAGLLVSAWNAGSKTLTFTTNRPSSMKAGHGIMYRSTVAPFSTGAPIEIASLGPGAAQVVLAEEPDNPPVAGDKVFAGGPLVATVRAALVAHLDSLGPARGDFATESVKWDGTLRTASLFKVAQLTTGVLDSEVVLPVVNTSPTNVPPSSSIAYLVGRQVLVRRKW